MHTPMQNEMNILKKHQHLNAANILCYLANIRQGGFMLD